MFEHWDSFYLLVGGASGGLIGLVFVVITLIRSNEATITLRTASVYMTPIIVHLLTALVLSALATAPALPPAAVGLIIGGVGLTALICAARVVVMMGLAHSITPAHWTDIWAYGLAPVASYLIVLGAAASAWIAPDWTARILGVGLIALLSIAVRNAWDLVTWITARGVTVNAPDAQTETD